MNTNLFLPGIIAVSWIAQKELPPQAMRKALARLPITIVSNLHTLDVVGNAECSAQEDVVNNGNHESVTLSFRSKNRPPHGPVAFVAHQAGGKAWLIGTRECLPPVVKVQTSAGKPGGEPAGFTVTVSFSAEIAMIPVLV